MLSSEPSSLASANPRGAALVAAGFGFAIVGSFYWPIPYDQIALPFSLLRPELLLVCMAAVLASTLGQARTAETAWWVSAAVPAAILARVLFEATLDPTSHNLWPFEIILTAPLGLACGWAGALAGKLLRPLARA